MIPVSRPTIKRKEMDAVLSTLVSDEIGPGAVAHELIKTVSSMLQCAGGYACSSYREALRLALSSLQLEEGAKVVLSALSPLVHLEAVKDTRLEPIFIDVDEANGSINTSEAISALETGAAALLLHYPLGFIPEIEPFLDSGVPIIEDITTALGGHDGNKVCGAGGDLVVLGLEPDHLVTAAGGGLVLAGKRKYLSRLKSEAESLSPSSFMPDLNASLGLVQIREAEQYFHRRVEIASVLTKALAKGRHHVLIQPGDCENVHYTFPVMVESSAREVAAYARKKGVETFLAFADAALSLFEEDAHFPLARQFMLRCLRFPLYPMLGKKQVEQIAKILSTLP
jgi:perosamine synthetase